MTPYIVKLRLALVLLIFCLVHTSMTHAQENPEKLLLPIGGGYSDTNAGFSAAVISRAVGNTAKILVLPTAYSTHPETITEAERTENIRSAEERRSQIEEACQSAAPQGVACTAILAPIFVRSDAQSLEISQYFTPDLTAVFILGGDQTIVMQALAGTPVETALTAAYERGVIIAGTSAGAGVQAAAMLGGYNLNFEAQNSLEFGAVDIWNTTEKHGLPFSIQDAILDQHFFQRGRLGRLLNAIALPDVPHIGIGVDAYTGMHVPNGERLENIFGKYVVAILDAETYHAANAAQYRGALHTLSMRSVLVHMLASGDFSYDLKTRQHSLAVPPAHVERTFETLALPKGTGALLLSGGLGDELASHPVLARFVNLSGGQKANILIVASGYPTDSLAHNAVEKYLKALENITTQSLIISSDASQPPELPASFTGIIFIGQDQSKIQPQLLSTLKEAWLHGTPLLADNAAAAAVGAFYSAHGPAPEDENEAEASTQKSLLQGGTNLLPGLGLLDLAVEPQVLNNNRWGRLFSLAYNHPKQLVIGLTSDTVLEITSQGAQVIGSNVVFVLDLRQAALALGDNQGFVIANGLLDVFAADEMVRPAVADINIAPIHASTPVLPTLTPLPSATPLPTITRTRSPKPTAVRPTRTLKILPTSTTPVRSTPKPVEIPPPADPHRVKALIGFAALIVAVIACGIWINHRHIT